MRKLSSRYSYEIIDDETIFYFGHEDDEIGIDFDTVYTLTNCYVTDNFNLNMLENFDVTISIEEISEKVFKDIAPTMKSAINNIKNALKLGLESSKETVTLGKDDILIVAQPDPNLNNFKYLLIEIEE